MKKWECTVCGYIHEGDEPPEECPVCGADRSKFVEIADESDADAASPEMEATADTTATSVAPSSVAAEQEPEADAADATDAAPEDIQPEPETEPEPVNVTLKEKIAALLEKNSHITDLMAKYHAHPISVHIPNGVLPVSTIFLFMALVFGSSGFEAAAYYNLVFVVLAMPLVFLTGYIDWQTQYKGMMTPLFRTKMICAAVVFGVGLLLVFWRLIDPEAAAPGSGSRWLFFLLELVMLGAASVAGYMGGKLIFKKK